MIGAIRFMKAPLPPPPKKIKTQQSACKIVANVFWDSEEVIYVDILPHGATSNAGSQTS
jgi:hypothetical protein